MIVVLAVTFAMILIAQVFFLKNRQSSSPEQSKPKPAATQTTPGNAPGTTNAAPEATAASPAAARSGKNKNEPAKVAAGETETTVENDLYRIVFTNQGAQVKQWILKKYKDDDGKPLDLVNAAATKYGLPLSLYAYDENLRNQLNTGLYVASEQGKLTAPAELTFEYSKDGVTARKHFTFGDSYVIGIETAVTQNGKSVQAYPSWPAGLGDQTTRFGLGVDSFGLHGQRQRGAPGRQESQQWQHPAWAFQLGRAAGPVLRRYLPARQSRNRGHGHAAQPVSVPKDPKKPDPNEVNKYDVLGVAVGDTSGTTAERLFAGPKALNVLESVRSNTAPGQMNGPDLRKVVDFGFFALIAHPLFVWLKWTHEHIVSSWGWRIVILTVIINLALLPLRISSMKSALKMQKVQPQMKAIQERYKKYPMRDPRRQEMNVEIGELYKREGVNPAGGCLPVVIQMPFLFAFYSMLANALELRQAPFLWLHDLSSPDKLLILPVLIVVSTYFMQKMTPNAGMDPESAAHHGAVHAADDRLLQLLICVRTERVLDDRQRGRHHPAVHDEPQLAWARRCAPKPRSGRGRRPANRISFTTDTRRTRSWKAVSARFDWNCNHEGASDCSRSRTGIVISRAGFSPRRDLLLAARDHGNLLRAGLLIF